MNSSVQTLSRRRTTSGSESNDRSRQLTATREEWQNVGGTERLVSASAGTILVAQGLARRDLIGLIVAGVGGALAFRGATGHCAAYAELGVNTAHDTGRAGRAAEDRGTRIS